jgi:hypothetical protein
MATGTAQVDRTVIHNFGLFGVYANLGTIRLSDSTVTDNYYGLKF